MSTWTEGEVLQLKKHGNAHTRNVWLANAPPVGTGGRPKEGDDINIFKRFVVDAYEHKRYYVEAGSNNSPPSVPNNDTRNLETRMNTQQKSVHDSNGTADKWSASSTAAFSENTSRSNGASSKIESVLPPVPAQPPVDLLDFGAFDESPTDLANTSSGTGAVGVNDFFSTPSAQDAVEVLDLFSSENVTNTATIIDREFGEFIQADQGPNTQAPTIVGGFDPFNSTNVPMSTSNDILPPMKPSNMDRNQNSSHSFDPFSSAYQPSNHIQNSMGQTQNFNMPGNTTNFHAGTNASNGMQKIDMFSQANNSLLVTQVPNMMNNHGYTQQNINLSQQMKSNTQNSFGMTNFNIMQHNLNVQGNNISKTFSSQPINGNAMAEEKKTDPFAGLGF
jgi:hypothetical protein